MVFATQIFLFWFLPCALLAYYVAPARLRTGVLTLLSFVFYGWWRLDFAGLMLFSAAVDYTVGRALGRTEAPGRRKLLLATSCVVNLALLGWFKYANFGVASLNALLARCGLEPMPWTAVVLPVGISFFTFQSMSYTIDVYRRQVSVVRSFMDFLCYVSLFPQLVAGPIVRYREIADQLRGRTHDLGKFTSGVLFFMIGFAKKILIADSLAPVADAAFQVWQPTTAEAWLGTFAYGTQIYFDFSGYSDMAIGMGLMLGFTFPINFDSPYKSLSITEFWRRWHISLSTWLRDYLYIPLGGNRGSTLRTGVNLAVTMLLGGLWHGAAWTFVAWGAWQGAWLVIERACGRRPLYAAAPRIVRLLATQVIVLFGWVLFRATALPQAAQFFLAMLGFGPGSAASVERLHLTGLPLVVLAVAVILTWGCRSSQAIVARHRWFFPLFIAACFALAVSHMLFQQYRPFLYFQF